MLLRRAVAVLSAALSLLTLACSSNPLSTDQPSGLRRVEPPAAGNGVVLAADDVATRGGLVAEFAAPAAAPDIATAPFKGKSRKVAKTTIAEDAGEFADSFSGVTALLDELPPDTDMDALEISKTGDGALRVEQESENVTILQGWLYAAKFEDDQDFHLIIGSDPAATTIHYINCEISGLPAKSKPDYAKLKAARKQFLDLLQTNGHGVPSASKYTHYKPPIKVEVAGSLFFDVDHKGGTVGPATRRAQTAWEIHPITQIQAVAQ